MINSVPNDAESERTVLVTALINDSLAYEIVDNLRDEDFFSPINARVFRAIQKLVDAGLPLEVAAILAELRKDPDGGEGATLYLSRLMDEPLTTNPAHYIGLLKECHRLRRVIQAAERATKAATGGIESARILGQLQADIFAIEGDDQQQVEASFGDLVDRAIDGVEAAQRGEASGLKTGLYRLDRETGGSQPGELIILSARPGMGKTAFALEIAKNAAMNGHAVGFFSMEMTAPQLALRTACSLAGVPYNRAVTGRLNGDEWSALVEAQCKLHSIPIHIDDEAALHIIEIGRRARRWKRVHNIELLVVDHIQLARSDNPRDRYLMVTEISAGLKAVAKELNIPVLALCQLNREVEKRKDRWPQLSDLRESGAIEQDADLVLGIYRAAYYKPDKADPNEAQIHILKQRNGRTCFVRIGWNGASMRFYNPVQT
jgi:replicative DNA helicase